MHVFHAYYVCVHNRVSCATFVSWWAQYEEEEIICKSRFIEYKEKSSFLFLRLEKYLKYMTISCRRYIFLGGGVVKGLMTVYLFLSVTVL